MGGPAGAQRDEGDERLEFRVLLATEGAARIGSQNPDLRQRQVEDLGNDLLQPVRVLDRAPDEDAVTVRSGHEPVGLDGEVGHHGECVRALDDEVADGPGHVPPADRVLAQDVGLGARVPGAEQRVLHQWRAGSQGRRQAEDSRQLQVVDPNEAGTLFGGVLGVGGNRRHRLAVILGLVDGQHRPVLDLGTEAGHRLG